MDNSYSDPTNQKNLDNPIEPENNVPIKTPTASSLSYIIKSMGGTKGISALFGMLLLAGGVGAGIVLVTQPQLLEQQAAIVSYSACDISRGNTDCPKGYDCSIYGCYIPAGVTICDPNASKSNCPGGSVCNPDSNRCISLNEVINCGGAQCAYKNCHCKGGDLCNLGYECYTDIQIANYCTDIGRSWCTNVQDGIGMTCCVAGYVCNPNGEGCVPGAGGPTSPPGGGSNPTPTPPITLVTASPSPRPTVSPSPIPSPTPSPTPTPIVAQCVSTNIYTPTWSPITIADFYNLPAGGQVYFCTLGSTNGLTFDKARFTINGVLRPEVTLKRPNGTDFCDLYTIPANTYSFTVQGEIHHATLGWQ